MNDHELLLYNKVHEAANMSTTGNSALYYAVLWGYTDIIVYLMKEAQTNHLYVQDAFDLAHGAITPSPERNCLRNFCNQISTCCLNIKMYYFRKSELNELLCHAILLDTLYDLHNIRQYTPPPITSTITNEHIATTTSAINAETEYKNSPICFTQNNLHQPIPQSHRTHTLDPKRKTAPKPPIGVPRIELGLKIKKYRDKKVK